LSDKASNKNIIFVDQLKLQEAKTKNFFKILENLKLREKKTTKEKKEAMKVGESKTGNKSVLVVLSGKDEAVKRSAKNISKVSVINADSLNIYDILRSKYLLMPVGAIEIIKKIFVNSAK